MRALAVCAILAVVAYAAKEALKPPTIIPTHLAPPVYAVGEPIAATVADSFPPIGEAPTTTPAVPMSQPLNGPATVAVSPERDWAVIGPFLILFALAGWAVRRNRLSAKGGPW